MRTCYLILYTGLIFVICSGSYCSCKREVDAPLFHLDQQTKDYTVFKTGSWWLYEDGSGSYDSVEVINSSIGTFQGGSPAAHYYSQYHNLSLRSSVNSEHIGFHASAHDREVSYGRYSIHISDVPVFFTKRMIGSTFTGLGHDVRYVDSLTNITLGNGITFTSVMIFEIISNPPTELRLPRKIYFSKNVGIIRKELFNGQVWELRSYAVLQ